MGDYISMQVLDESVCIKGGGGGGGVQAKL